MSSFTQPGVKGGCDSIDSSIDELPDGSGDMGTQPSGHRKAGPRAGSGDFNLDVEIRQCVDKAMNDLVYETEGFCTRGLRRCPCQRPLG